MTIAAKDFWVGRAGLGRHFWLYFVLPMIILSGIADVLVTSGWTSTHPSGPAVNAALYSTAALAGLVASVPVLRATIQSKKAIVWKILVVVVVLLFVTTILRIAYDSISHL